MSSFGSALRALNLMKEERVIDEYAIAGAMALVFWVEPVPTYDLDVLVFLPRGEGQVLSLDPLYRWAGARGYPAKEEHILIEGLPTQLVPSPNPLSDEAITSAEIRDYEGVAVRVVRPEYLVALYLQPGADTRKRRERVATLLEWPALNRSLLNEILSRYGLSL